MNRRSNFSVGQLLSAAILALATVSCSARMASISPSVAATGSKSTYEAAAPSGILGSNDASYAEPPKSSRQGLATSWGDLQKSPVVEVAFTRQSDEVPDKVISIFYNDEKGVIERAGSSADLEREPFQFFGDTLSVGIRKESFFGHRYFQGTSDGESLFVVGQKGTPYEIEIRNNNPTRIEVVASVDGLDVIDGRPASYRKRGYLIDPFSTFVIRGFRTSESQVAEFKFGSVGESYSQQKYGDTRNVGVIGLAVFREIGSAPLGSSQENETRKTADPFPGRFATPPAR